MGRIFGLWSWVQRLTGIFLLVCICLYILRCVMTVSLLSFDNFEHFFRGLLRYIFG
jgi:succinate dehydrogenase/fumarate reductase cytochrome b subunit